MIFTIVAALFTSRVQGKKAPSPQDFVAAAFALGGAITLVRILIKVLTQETLQADLEWDGTIALCISATLGTYLALREFVKVLF
ncbi:MAG: hypothetical protein WBA76_06175 [Phormidesmis sp.]